jgi:hypothetical protein
MLDQGSTLVLSQDDRLDRGEGDSLTGAGTIVCLQERERCGSEPEVRPRHVRRLRHRRPALQRALHRRPRRDGRQVPGGPQQGRRRVRRHQPLRRRARGGTGLENVQQLEGVHAQPPRRHSIPLPGGVRPAVPHELATGAESVFRPQDGRSVRGADSRGRGRDDPVVRVARRVRAEGRLRGPAPRYRVLQDVVPIPIDDLPWMLDNMDEGIYGPRDDRAEAMGRSFGYRPT